MVPSQLLVVEVLRRPLEFTHDLPLHVAGQGEAEPAEVALRPREVAVLAVAAAANHLGAGGVELGDAPREAADLRGAHDGEVERVEEEHHPLAGVVTQLDVDELALEDALEGDLGAF